VSPVAEYITGYKVEELQNKPFAAVIHPDDHAGVFEAWEEALKKPEERHRIEYRHIHKTKGYIWVEAHGQSFLHDPNINRVFTFVRDISDRKELEFKLMEQQEKYDIIAENISDVIWIFNASLMRFTYVSPSVERLRGYTVEEAIKQNITESLAPESVALVQKRLVEAMEMLSKDPTKLVKSVEELQQPCKNGELIWIEVSVTIQINAKGELEVLGVSRNIEQRKKALAALKESEEKYRKLIQNMDEGMLLFDQSNKIVSFNEAAKRILKVDESLEGLNSEFFMNRTIHEDGSPFIPQEHPDAIVIREKRSVKNVVMGLTSENEVTWIKINAEYLNLGNEKTGFALVNFYDITELKEKNKALVQANKTKDKFISIIAHDLKSPFNAIVGYTELLMESSKENHYDDLLHMSEATHNSSIQAVNLLDNLLDWSRAQTDKLQFQPAKFSLKEMVENILFVQQIVAERKEIKLSIDINGVDIVYGDCNMIQTIMRNLISNAIKFSYRGGEVMLRFSTHKNSWVLVVIDHGQGMQERNVNSLLDGDNMFSNVGTAGEQGTGLGFSVINEFVKLHKGKIEINSVPAKGTTVKISFPKG